MNILPSSFAAVLIGLAIALPIVLVVVFILIEIAESTKRTAKYFERMTFRSQTQTRDFV